MPSEPNRLFPPFRLDPTDAQLWRDNERINLRRKTFEVLRYLLDHPGQLVTKATLLDAVWSEVSVSDSMPATCVTEIRRALGDDAKTPRFIETVHRRGYRFVAKVTTAAFPKGPPSPRRVMPGPKPIVVGREAELARLQSRFAEVLEGQRRVIFVAGEAGMARPPSFKSSLMQFRERRCCKLGAKTTLITRHEFGGMGATDGPVPVRTLAHAARLIREARQLGQYGIAVSEPMLEYPRLLARRLLEYKVSAVVDLYELKLPNRRRFVNYFWNHSSICHATSGGPPWLSSMRRIFIAPSAVRGTRNQPRRSSV
jgi:DNA-binding winged helix-turn-helix (wHTH) protein